MAYTIAIHNLKGGVGKTTLTAILALGLAEKYRVLLIDFDSQMSLTQIFLPEETRLKILEGSEDNKDNNIPIFRTSISILRENHPNIHQFTHVPPNGKIINIDIIPGSYVEHLDGVFKGKIPMYEPLVARNYIREHLAKRYDFILIDNAPSDVMTLKPALLAADYILIPEDGTVEAFNAAKVLLKYALPKYIWKYYDYPKVIGVVLTKVRSSALRLLLKHNTELEKVISQNELTKMHVAYHPIYFGADAKDPRDYILSSNKQFLSDLIWTAEDLKAPIGDVYDKLFVVNKKLQPDIFAYLFKILRNIPNELVRRIMNVEK